MTQFDFSGDSLSKSNPQINALLRRLNVNEVNSYLLSLLIQLIESKVTLLKGPQDKISRTEIDAILHSTLKEYNKFIESKLVEKEDLIKTITEKSQKDLLEIEKLMQDVDRSSLFLIKVLIGLLVVQFAVLYYITYHVAGWDVGEPVSYLIGITKAAIGRFATLPSHPVLPEEESRPHAEVPGADAPEEV